MRAWTPRCGDSRPPSWRTRPHGRWRAAPTATAARCRSPTPTRSRWRSPWATRSGTAGRPARAHPVAAAHGAHRRACRPAHRAGPDRRELGDVGRPRARRGARRRGRRVVGAAGHAPGRPRGRDGRGDARQRRRARRAARAADRDLGVQGDRERRPPPRRARRRRLLRRARRPDDPGLGARRHPARAPASAPGTATRASAGPAPSPPPATSWTEALDGAALGDTGRCGELAGSARHPDRRVVAARGRRDRPVRRGGVGGRRRVARDGGRRRGRGAPGRRQPRPARGQLGPADQPRGCRDARGHRTGGDDRALPARHAPRRRRSPTCAAGTSRTR